MDKLIDTFKQTADRIAFLDRGYGIERPDVQSAIEKLYTSTPKALMFDKSGPREPLFNFMLKEKVIVKGKGDWYDSIRETGNVIRAKNGDLVLFTSGVVGETYTQSNVYVGVSISKDNGATWSDLVKLEGLLPSEDPYCVLHDDVYYLFVEDKSVTPFQGIRLYTSEDLVNWEDNGPILDPSSGEWDSRDVSSPTVIIENGTFYLFYEGRASGADVGHEGAIGLAVSTDGVTWTKHEDNPIVTAFGGPRRFGKSPTVTFGRAVVPDDIIKSRNRYFMTVHIELLNQWHSALLGSEELNSGWVFLTKLYPSDPPNQGGVMFHWSDYSVIGTGRGDDTSIKIYRPGVV